MTREETLKVAKPILFNTQMVKAVLEGRKTVTRRVVKPSQMQGIAPDRCPNHTPEEFINEKHLFFKPYCDMSDEDFIRTIFKEPYQIGDILYVRETWNHYKRKVISGIDKGCIEKDYFYKASPEIKEQLPHYVQYHYGTWRPSIHMPKEAARIFLRITSVRAEKLQEIDGQGVLKEGVNTHVHPNASYFDVNQRDAFARLWDSTIKKRIWMNTDGKRIPGYGYVSLREWRWKNEQRRSKDIRSIRTTKKA